MPTPFETLVESEKLIAGSPIWRPKPNSKGVLKLVASLRIGSRVMQGLELIGQANATIRNCDVSFVLIYLPSDNRREAVRFCRIDWRPLTPHSNDHPNTPPELIGDIPGSHHHAFRLNWSAKNGAPLKALPIAEEITPDYQSFKQLLDGVAHSFRIANAASLPSPWPEDLFDDKHSI